MFRVLLSSAALLLTLFLIAPIHSATPQVPAATAPQNEDPALWGRQHQPYIAILCGSASSKDHADCARHQELAFRDDTGRVRTESFYNYGGPMGIQIDDPEKGTRTIFYPAKKNAVIVNAPRVHPLPPGDTWSVEPLPAKTIVGITVPGERFTRMLHDGDKTGTLVIEDWISQELGIVLEHHVHNSLQGDSAEFVTALDLSSPDQSLFELPSGYSVQRMP